MPHARPVPAGGSFVLWIKGTPLFFCLADKYIHREARYNSFILYSA